VLQLLLFTASTGTGFEELDLAKSPGRSWVGMVQCTRAFECLTSATSWTGTVTFLCGDVTLDGVND